MIKKFVAVLDKRVEAAPRKKQSEGPNFYRTESVHTDPSFIAKIGPTLRFIISVIWRHGSILELLCCDNGIHGPIVWLGHSDFLSD